MELQAILSELERLAEENDAQALHKDQMYLNITRDTGEFLAVLIKAAAVKRVLEVGTSNGYSTLWIAAALPEDGQVTSLEISLHKIDQARNNSNRAKLAHKIHIVQCDASDYLRESNEQFDLVFLDADRTLYMKCADDILARIRPGGLLVCDNAVSHRTELQEFVEYVAARGDFTSALVPVGKGEFVACKSMAMCR